MKESNRENKAELDKAYGFGTFGISSWMYGIINGALITWLGCGWENMQTNPVWMTLWYLNLATMIVGAVCTVICAIKANKALGWI